MMSVPTGSRPDWDRIVHSEEIKEWLQQSKSIRILITGKTGTGKSSLVNGIVGKYVAEEGAGLDHETTTVVEYRTTIRDVEVIIYDSPGLEDRTSKDEKYLKDMEEKCKKVDLILYCIKMDDKRVDTGYTDSMSKLSHAFGAKSFWDHTLFVLTFANMVNPPPARPGNTVRPLQTYFCERLAQWKAKIAEILHGIGVEKEITEKIPVVPAGYHGDPSFPVAEYEFWLSNLWCTCLDRIADTAKPAFLKINWTRLRTSKEEKKEDNVISKGNTYAQPIVFDSNVVVPATALEFLGLAPRLSVAGKVGGGIGSALGFWVGGGTGMELGGVAGAILAELVYKYGMKHLENLNKK